MLSLKHTAALALLGGAVAFAPAAATAQTAFEKLVALSKAEVDKKGGTLDISLDWTDTDAAPVMKAFMAEFPFVKKVNFSRETGVGQFGGYLLSLQQGNPPQLDILHVASEFEQQYWDAGAFVKPLIPYKDLAAALPKDYPPLEPRLIGPDGNFIATTGNARGVIWNPALFPVGYVPTNWAECHSPALAGKVLLDARNKLQPFQWDKKERDRHVTWLKAMVANKVVLVRGQAGVLQKVASGEFPMACGMNYHTATRAMEIEGVKTIKFAFPESIPLELATRLYVPKWSKTPATVQLFAVWAVTKGQEYLAQSAYRGFPWNQKAAINSLAKGKTVVICDAACATGWEDYNKEYAGILGIPYVPGEN
jgi:ABC-type Fe3+ transport system substrate-binding protein